MKMGILEWVNGGRQLVKTFCVLAMVVPVFMASGIPDNSGSTESKYTNLLGHHHIAKRGESSTVKDLQNVYTEFYKSFKEVAHEISQHLNSNAPKVIASNSESILKLQSPYSDSFKLHNVDALNKWTDKTIKIARLYLKSVANCVKKDSQLWLSAMKMKLEFQMTIVQMKLDELEKEVSTGSGAGAGGINPGSKVVVHTEDLKKIRALFIGLKKCKS